MDFEKPFCFVLVCRVLGLCLSAPPVSTVISFDSSQFNLRISWQIPVWLFSPKLQLIRVILARGRFQNLEICFCSDLEHAPGLSAQWRALQGRLPGFSRAARQLYCSVVEIELLLRTVWISTNWLSLMENAMLEDFQPILLILQGKI